MSMFLCATWSQLLSCVCTDTIPVSSSTDWQAAFGFGSSKQQQQEDDLGFDPFDITRRALADLIEKELSVEDSFSSSLSPSFLPHRNHKPLLNKGLGPPGGLPLSNHHLHSHHFSQNHHRHTGGYGFPSHLSPSSSSSSSASSSSSSCSSTVFSSPSSSAFRQSWTGSTASRSNFVHLNHTVSPAASTSNCSFSDFTQLPGHHSTGLGGIPITGKTGSGRGWSQRSDDVSLLIWITGVNAVRCHLFIFNNPSIRGD